MIISDTARLFYKNGVSQKKKMTRGSVFAEGLALN